MLPATVKRATILGRSLFWAVVTIAWPHRFVDRLTPFILANRHSRQRAEAGFLLASILPSDDILGAEIRQRNLELAKIARRSLVSSMGLILGVLLIVIIISWWGNKAIFPQSTGARMGAISVLILVAGTLGTVGWSRQSREDLTTIGMADRMIYWGLYGLGGLLGVLAFLL